MNAQMASLNALMASQNTKENHMKLKKQDDYWEKRALFYENVCRAKILKAIKKGNFEAECVCLNNDSVDSLKKDGYRVRYYESIGDSFHAVKW